MQKRNEKSLEPLPCFSLDFRNRHGYSRRKALRRITMETLKFNLSQSGNKFKILNATNGGPWHKRHANDQYRSNFADYKAARIPYSRNHDSAVHGIYGGPYSHDITRIFPNFDADPLDPASYDFACTDEVILVCLDAGTETFFRLGQTIEHQIKKHGTIPPKDFQKWAVICEHIIRHYNGGWADGHHLNIQYWEIWNEPDLDLDDSPNKRCWGGTKAQFFDLYEIAAKHLKGCFPHLKIGGPALAHREDWAEDFLYEMQKRNVPIDFFSWHIDCTDFVMACICEAQRTDALDMLMYYDTRPSAFCGAFDFYTYDKLKGYYPLYWYGMFYDMVKEVQSDNRIDDIYSLCGVSPDGKVLSVITHYSDDDTAESKTLSIDFGKCGSYEVYLLDAEHDGELVQATDKLIFI